jgi:hypothetical protein
LFLVKFYWKRKKLIKGMFMQRIILLVVCSVFLPFHVFASEIYNHDFNDGSWGSLVHGKFWTLQSTGGVGNSKAIRLQYSEAGNNDKWSYLDLSQANSNDFWVEFDVKMEGNCSGGSKFVKFFGSNDVASQNNMTFLMDYGNCTQGNIQYKADALCKSNYNGTGYCGALYNYTSGSINMSGGSWGHYKIHVKRADRGVQNGTLKVWWNGSLVVDMYHIDSNPVESSTGKGIDHVEFGGYNNATYYKGSTWYLWLDNIYVGTTEKGGGSGTTSPPVDKASPPLAPADFKSVQN